MPLASAAAAVAALVDRYGAVMLAMTAFLEHSFLLGLAVPGDAVMLVAGALCARHLLHAGSATVAVVAGTAAGLAASYEVGRHVGRSRLLAWSARFGVSAVRWEGLSAWFADNGARAAFAATFVIGIKNVVPVVAGAVRVPMARFLAAATLGAMLRALACGAVGWVCGAQLDAALAVARRADRVLLVAIALAAIVVWMRRRFGVGGRR